MRRKEIVILVLLYLFLLPFLNPWVRGDGVPCYAYIRSVIIDGDLQFANEFYNTDMKRLLNWDKKVVTKTGHIPNEHQIGTAIFWIPFFLAGHVMAFILNFFGAKVFMDGFSYPYTVSCAFGSSLYGFLGLLLIYSLCRQYFSASVSLISVISTWLASSFVFYMYLRPIHYHAISIFTVSLFMYFWWKTRYNRTLKQWILLGVIAGLMIQVRFIDAIFFIVLLMELYELIRIKKYSHNYIIGIVLFALSIFIIIIPHFIVRNIIDGSFFRHGYEGHKFYLANPQILSTLFSSAHGLFSWTPILLFSTIGIFLFLKKDKVLAVSLILSFLIMFYLTACWVEWWAGSSFGNRFFCEFAMMFAIGLASMVNYVMEKSKISVKIISGLCVFLIIWNFLFMYQFAAGLIPREDYISWKKMLYNQVCIVPGKITVELKDYLFNKRNYLHKLEIEDTKMYKKGEIRKELKRPDE